MSTEAYKKLGEAAEDAGLLVFYEWAERFDWLLIGIEVDGVEWQNPDFENEFFDAKFDGGGNDAVEAEARWRE